MDPVTHRVTVRLHDQPGHLPAPADFAVPYFADGCPEQIPDWPASDGRYTHPHQDTVCPGCLPTARLHAHISDPFPAPANQPMIYFLGAAPTAPDVRDTAGGRSDLLRLLHAAGFTRAGWLPLPGFDRPFVADHPAAGTRVILDVHGVELYLRDPDTGRPFHVFAGPRIDLPLLHAALTAGGHPACDISAPTVPVLPARPARRTIFDRGQRRGPDHHR
ncbi:hypothetical protein [Frankia sp. ACN1ag]|uniref:hypothetical protein n=1 Tax=Frankia sp. ACN1ag TaxID=102891 RepID=UPI0006DC51FE|nr:hypothetical protein [Frankia sp. ACN1ag]